MKPRTEQLYCPSVSEEKTDARKTNLPEVSQHGNAQSRDLTLTGFHMPYW